jgi:DNA polymerase-3 subunit epsilon
VHLKQVVAIDVETTGFGKSDRVVEVGLVVYDLDSNQIIGQIDTLLNPDRNIPKESSQVHGILAEHVSLAPTFQEVSDFLHELLSKNLVVAHNADFDLRFIRQEFLRIGSDLEVKDVECTYRLTGQSLAVACEDISFEFRHHSAVEDAKAALAVWLAKQDRDTSSVHQAEHLPELQLFRTVRRSHIGLAEKPKGDSSLSGLRLNLTQSGAELTYLGLIDTSLRDFSISQVENLGLSEFAAESGISESREVQLREEYLDELHKAALRDGIVTDAESEYFNQISKALGSQRTLEPSSVSKELPPAGSLICVTGTLTYKGVHFGKAEISAFLEEKGFVFTDVLSKKAGVALLLQESAGSQSSKVGKAQAWGIRRMVTSDFLSLF